MKIIGMQSVDLQDPLAGVWRREEIYHLQNSEKAENYSYSTTSDFLEIIPEEERTYKPLIDRLFVPLIEEGL